jgi:AcrR family transcriptional regulator
MGPTPPAVDRTETPASPNDRRRQLRQQKAELSRLHILEAAEEVFAERGYQNATIREIAALAGFSPAAVYTFVTSKKDLIVGILNHHGDVLMELHNAVLADGTDAGSQLHAIADVELDYHIGRPDYGRIVQLMIGQSFFMMEAAVDDGSQIRSREIVGIVEEIFRSGMAEGVFEKGDPHLYSIVFSGIMQSYLYKALIQDEGEDQNRTELHRILNRAFFTSGSVTAA